MLSQREETRLQVLNKVLGKQLSVREASDLLRISERHGWRLLAAYRKEGASALVHGNRGHQPSHTISQDIKARVQELAQERYRGLNHCHLAELLGEREEIRVSRSTVRRVLVAAGLKSPKHRRPPKHRCRRERYPQEGMLLQIDGSYHDWPEGRGPRLTLVAAVDDATGRVVSALFREHEDAQGYFLLLQEIIQSRGIPLALYSDRHGIFQRSPKDPETLEEQLSGQRQPTQFGRALWELGIQSILALSPQAKGRIERLFGTLQDRLVVELRLAGASTAEAANRVLEDFIPRFNARFSVPATQPGFAYRQLPVGLDLAAALCFKYQRTVARDNTVRFAGRTIQLLPGLGRSSYTHARVEIQERLDGSVVVSYQGHVIATTAVPPHPVTLRARKNNQGEPLPPPASCVTRAPAPRGGNGHKPSPNHPWRRMLLTKSLNT